VPVFHADQLLADAARILPGVVDVRRHIHREPELGLELPRTQAVVLDALAGLPAVVTTGTRQSSVVVDIEGTGTAPKGGPRTVLLRADMDALPMPENTGLEFASEVAGVMHSCGHDAHTAMLVGAAGLLAARRAEFAGTVRLAFQPGEEGFGGARLLLEEGVLEPGVEAVFALHVSPNLPSGALWTRPGPLMASADRISIVIRGRGGHASTPHLANDPMPVAAEVVQALQTFVTRRVNAFDPVVITIAKIRAGTTDNVIPEDVKMMGTLRAVSESGRRHAIAGIERVVRGIAAAHDMDADVDVHAGYPVTVNDARATTFVQRVAEALLGHAHVGTMPAPVMGSEDFSYLLQQRPGALSFLGACPPETSPARAPACHSNRMVIDEEAMRCGIAMHAALALEYLAAGLGA
jgi:hippurate hydrolase